MHIVYLCGECPSPLCPDGVKPQPASERASPLIRTMGLGALPRRPHTAKLALSAIMYRLQLYRTEGAPRWRSSRQTVLQTPAFANRCSPSHETLVTLSCNHVDSRQGNACCPVWGECLVKCRSERSSAALAPPPALPHPPVNRRLHLNPTPSILAKHLVSSFARSFARNKPLNFLVAIV